MLLLLLRSSLSCQLHRFMIAGAICCSQHCHVNLPIQASCPRGHRPYGTRAPPQRHGPLRAVQPEGQHAAAARGCHRLLRVRTAVTDSCAPGCYRLLCARTAVTDSCAPGCHGLLCARTAAQLPGPSTQSRCPTCWSAAPLSLPVHSAFQLMPGLLPCSPCSEHSAAGTGGPHAPGCGTRGAAASAACEGHAAARGRHGPG